MKLQTTSMEKETKVEQTVKFTYINMYGDTDLFSEISTYLKGKQYTCETNSKVINIEDILKFKKENPSIKLMIDNSYSSNGSMYYDEVTFTKKEYSSFIVENIENETLDYVSQKVEDFRNSDKEKLYSEEDIFLLKFTNEYSQQISLPMLSSEEQDYAEQCMLEYKKNHNFTTLNKYGSIYLNELLFRNVLKVVKNTYKDNVEIMENGLFSVAVVNDIETNTKYLISLFGINNLTSRNVIPIMLVDNRYSNHRKRYKDAIHNVFEENMVNIILPFDEIYIRWSEMYIRVQGATKITAFTELISGKEDFPYLYSETNKSIESDFHFKVRSSPFAKSKCVMVAFFVIKDTSNQNMLLLTPTSIHLINNNGVPTLLADRETTTKITFTEQLKDVSSIDFDKNVLSDIVKVYTNTWLS